MKLADAAWAAGFFDGEGTIGIHARTLQVRVANTFLPSLLWFRQRFGGAIITDRKPTDRWRPAFRWGIYGRAARDFLVQIIPHLKEKKPQARIAVAWFERPDKTPEITENARAELADMKRPQYSLKELSELEEAYLKKNDSARRRRGRLQDRGQVREADRLGRRRLDAARRRGRGKGRTRRQAQGAGR